MSNPYKTNLIIFAFLVITAFNVNAQITVDSLLIKKEYSNFEEALKTPEKVYRLNLSNQKFKMPSDSIWARFSNLEYLNLKNNHLTNLPAGIGNLKSLRVLDLSSNDFKILPQSFSSLENLTEIYLNDEKKMDIDKSLLVIENLPNLRILHLENDDLKEIPKNLLHLRHLEILYLNNNKFKQPPVIDLKILKNLNYIDLHDNKFRLNNQDFQNQGFGPKIRF
jgi:Leucine-rich repeat (LRR) protein